VPRQRPAWVLRDAGRWRHRAGGADPGGLIPAKVLVKGLHRSSHLVTSSGGSQLSSAFDPAASRRRQAVATVADDLDPASQAMWALGAAGAQHPKLAVGGSWVVPGAPDDLGTRQAVGQGLDQGRLSAPRGSLPIGPRWPIRYTSWLA
jgi:hypothetical protein